MGGSSVRIYNGIEYWMSYNVPREIHFYGGGIKQYETKKYLQIYSPKHNFRARILTITE